MDTPREKTLGQAALDYLVRMIFIVLICITLNVFHIQIVKVVENTGVEQITTLSGQLSSCEEQNQALNILLDKKLK